MYTHIKTKHNTNGQSTGRGRGRPKKDTGDSFNPVKSLYNPSTFEFFKSPDKVGETLDLRPSLEEIYNELYNLKEENKCSTFEEFPFFKKILEANLNPPQLDGETSKCDEIFSEYLIKVSKNTRSEFFTRLVKFVCLFRDCLNKVNQDKNKNEEGLEFSEVTNAEDAPDISNDFVTEYLETDVEKYGFSKEDAVDLTQNFCQWLYDNNFTCSKLSLINNTY